MDSDQPTTTSAGSGEEPVRVLLAFVVASQRYALEVRAVERVLPMVAVTPVVGAPKVALGAISVHGRVVAVVDIRRRLGLVDHLYETSACLILTVTRTRTLAVAADEVLGVLELPAEAVVAPATVLPEPGRFGGIAPLPEGLLLVHDLDAFLTPDEELQLAGALAGGGA